MALRLEADHRSLRDDPTLPEQVHDRAREKGIRESDFALFEEWADAFDPLKKEIAFYGLAEMEEFLAEAEAALPTLPDYLAFLARFDEAEAEGIAPFVEEYRLSVAPIEEMKRAFSRVYFTQWSDKILAAEPKARLLFFLFRPRALRRGGEEDLRLPPRGDRPRPLFAHPEEKRRGGRRLFAPRGPLPPRFEEEVLAGDPPGARRLFRRGSPT